MNKYFIESDEMVDEALSLIKGDILACDTETNGLDHFGGKLWCIQIADSDNGFLFPYNALSDESKTKLKKFLADKLLVAHNAKFDYKFLRQNGFEIKELYCTQISEKLLYQGKYFTFGLKDVLLRRYQIKMDKEIRKDFYDGTFSEEEKKYGTWGIWDERPDLVEYALDDIEYLLDIREQQLEEARQCGMENVLKMENLTIKTVADIELRGVFLDVEEAKKFESIVTERRDILGHEIFTALRTSWDSYWLEEFTRRNKMYQEWEIKHKKVVSESNKMRLDEDKRKKTDEAKEMVAKSLEKKPFSSLPKLENEFNPNSSAKLKVALSRLMGYPIPNTKKEWLEENIHIHPAIETLVEYRKFEKLAQFCALQEDVNPHTGRIHGRLDQVGTESGRFSHSNPNLGQIPARTEEGAKFRALFKPQPGRKYLQADYAGLELVILADSAGEDILVDAINGGKDIHCFTMGQMIDCPYEILVSLKEGEELDGGQEQIFMGARDKFNSSFSLPELQKIEDYTKWVKKLRDYVKTLTYGVAYGLSAFGLSNKFHCDFKVAESFISHFFKVYPNLDGFLKMQGDIGLQRGYALNPFGRRRYFHRPKMKSYQEIEKEVITDLDKQKRIWTSVEDEEWTQLMEEAIERAKREYKGKINSIKRRSANFYPQSVNADMTKTALFLLDKSFKSRIINGWFGGVVLVIHDEIIMEVFDEDIDRASAALKHSMETAGRKFVKNCNIEVKVKVMERWMK